MGNEDALIRQRVLGTQPSSTAPHPAPAPEGSAPAAPDPVAQELGILRAKAVQQEQQIAALSARADELMGALSARSMEDMARKTELPKEEDLEGLSRVEAIRKVAEPLIQVETQRLLGGMRAMAEDVVEAKGFVEESQIRELFPAVDLNKYRPAIHTMKMRNPRMSAVDALRLVADPRELVAPAPQDTTPQPQDAFRVESGRSAARSAPPPSPNRSMNEASLKQAYANAKAAGNKVLADSYMLEIIKGRADVPAQRRT